MSLLVQLGTKKQRAITWIKKEYIPRIHTASLVTVELTVKYNEIAPDIGMRQLMSYQWKHIK